MKYLISLLFITAIISSCKKDTVQTDLELSRKVWLAFKKSANNNYSYTVTRVSWAGFGDSTVIAVVNGMVSGRKYTGYTIDGKTGQKIIRESWTEIKASLNTHQSGAAILTLDEVYEKAAREWFRADPKQNTIYLETNNQGMISVCGYVQTGCQDDCFNGIRISNIIKGQSTE